MNYTGIAIRRDGRKKKIKIFKLGQAFIVMHNVQCRVHQRNFWARKKDLFTNHFHSQHICPS